METVESLLGLVALLVIISCALSIMLSPLTGKVDPFLLIRPPARLVSKLPGRFFRWSANSLDHWSAAARRQAHRDGTGAGAKIAWHLVAFILWTGGFFLFIPAEILGSAK